jgi:hypothetical protein
VSEPLPPPPPPFSAPPPGSQPPPPAAPAPSLPAGGAPGAWRAPGPPLEQPLLRLRPLGLGEVLDDIFRVYRRHFGLLVGIAAVLSVPTFAVQLASRSADQLGFLATVVGAALTQPQAALNLTPPESPGPGVVALLYLVIIVTVPFSVGAVTWAAIALLLGNPVSVRSSLLAVASRYWALLGLAALYLLIAPTAFCLPVLVWLAIRWIVAVPALLAEGIGPIRALDRSWNLTRGNWWRLFGIMLIIYLLANVIQGALGVFAFPLALVVPFVAPVVRGAIILAITTAAQTLVLPVMYLGIVLLYFDLRVRAEAFDLDQLARQAAPAP